MRQVMAIVGLLLLPGCASAVGESGVRPSPGSVPPVPTEPNSSQPTAELPPPPWSRPALAAAEVEEVQLAAWRAAENRESCALLVPVSLGAGEGATARRATFAGGWGIAYDQPGLRSAFGVAGTGADAGAEGTYDDWPYERRWSDGSRAGYGPEGGTGPNLLAYLRVDGQACLYNVWSRLGVQHLEHLLQSLRLVEE